MKAASNATLAILAGGQYIKIECYKFALANGSNYYFSAGDGPITVAGITYVGGLTFIRGSLTQKVGLDSQSVDLTIAPQLDNPAGAVTFNGQGFLSACRSGALDGCRITMYKGFFVPSGTNAITIQIAGSAYTYTPPAAGYPMDTTPGLVPWFQGTVNELQTGRFSVDITVNDDIELMRVQMPRNVLCAGCVHTLFDAGCTLNKSQNTYTGKIATVVSANTIDATYTTGIAFAQADDYFDLGVVTFTSGVLNGGTYPIGKYLNSGGSFQSIIPWAATPSVGDTFSVVPGCDKQQATCSSNKFVLPSGSAGSNLLHFRGAPYVPQPETLYDGGTISPAGVQTPGSQGGVGAGSTPSSGNSRNYAS